MKTVELKIEKIVPGGQGIARTDESKVAFVWGALPGETIEVEITKNKSKYVEATTVKVLKASKYRCEPKDEAYLSTSPWQIMDFEQETKLKTSLITEVFAQNDIKLPKFETQTDGLQWNYRNKMEYSFWWVPETDSIELAFFQRGKKIKVPVTSSALANTDINDVALQVRDQLNELDAKAKTIKTLLVRCDQNRNIVASLFVKAGLKEFSKIRLTGVQGFEVWLSDHRSPASVRTKLLHSYGDISLSDELLGKKFGYDVHSFFQINLPVYEMALKDIKTAVAGDTKIIDMYCGVGSIGLSVSDTPILIEQDEPSFEWAKKNASDKSEAINAKAEDAHQYITKTCTLIVDPPRTGLHKDLVAKIIGKKPQKLVYLSCDAATHARDINILLDAGYKLDKFWSYNFFPKTPHTETLAILVANS